VERVSRLEATFRHIAATRMAGLPILHPRLHVQAVDFAPVEAGVGTGEWVGVLVTPWFMNLVRLPAAPVVARAKGGRERPATDTLPAPGQAADLAIGGWTFRFLGHEEPGCGRFAAASLVSPMHGFEDQPAAIATARALLERLRPPPARRAFLLGRGDRAVAVAGAAPR